MQEVTKYHACGNDSFKVQDRPMGFHVRVHKFTDVVSDPTLQLTFEKLSLGEF